MSDFINFFHAAGDIPVTSNNKYSVGFKGLLIQWLVRQQKILQPGSGEYAGIAKKLHDMIDRIDWNNLISGAFFSNYFLRIALYSLRLSPFLINEVDTWDKRVIWAIELYSHMMLLSQSSPFKEDGVFATSHHTTISEFFLHALFNCPDKDMRSESSDWEKSCIPILINNVQWHYHLSHAIFTEKILLAILTIHHMFTRPDFKNSHFIVRGPNRPVMDSDQVMRLDIIKRLPVSFAQGVVAWLKNHTRQDNFEWWSKGIPGMEEVIQSQQADSDLGHNPSYSALESTNAPY